jgi:DNA-binding beta-propeller fold protein YncE
LQASCATNDTEPTHWEVHVHAKLILPFALLFGCHEGKTPPPWGTPITGGTMTINRSGSHAIISDPDRDRILTVDLATRLVTAEITLTQGEQPGRVVEDDAGRFHVAMRQGGDLVTFNVVGEVLDRRYACGEPRGVAFDPATANLYVACATGELVTFAAAGGPATRSIRLERDLRDVVVQGGNLVVSKFRSAELLTVDAASGSIVTRVAMPLVQRFGGFGGGIPDAKDGGTAPVPPGGGGGLVNAPGAVAWRTVQLPDGRILVSHQRQVLTKLETQTEGGYGTGCGGPVEAAVTMIAPGQAPVALSPIAQGALPVDLAVSKNGDKIAILTAGNRNVRVQQTTFVLGGRDQNDCRPPDFPDPPMDPGDPGDDDDDQGEDEDVRQGGAPTSIAFAPSGDLVVFYPEKPMLKIHHGGNVTTAPEIVQLPGGPGIDAGRHVFHKQTNVGLACASCHPEGREDGLVWEFSDLGVRRTQNLSGHILERAPYHWTGDENSLPTLMDDVFAKRMAGGALTERQKRSLGPWLDRVPPPAASWVSTNDAIDRGREIFEAAETGCKSCHNGSILTNNVLADVGTGGKFKVPSLLGVGARSPFMHDGCAKTLKDRFTTCGNSALHGNTSNLSPAQIGDLVAYLESL